MTLARAILADTKVRRRILDRGATNPLATDFGTTPIKDSTALRSLTPTPSEGIAVYAEQLTYAAKKRQAEEQEEEGDEAEDDADIDIPEADLALPPLEPEPLPLSTCEEHAPTSDEDSDGEPLPKLGAGWWGRGPPLLVHLGPNKGDKPLEDGGGLCSPGRWSPATRRLPSDFGERITPKLVRILQHWGDQTKGGIQRLVYQMATGRLKESPFPVMVVKQLKDAVREELRRIRKERGWPAFDKPPAKGQWVDVRFLQDAMEVAGDPDHKSMNKFAEGVRVGWRRKMPRTPAVFERKKQWRLDISFEEEDVHTPANYRSSMDRKEGLTQQFEKDEKARFMYKTTYAKAKELWPDSLRIAAMGATEQAGKEWRYTHDATHGIHVNNEIRPRDRPRNPMGGDVKRMVSELSSTPGTVFSLVFDVSKAHRRVLVHNLDWGVQACTDAAVPPTADDDTVWLNLVGTYGVGSASYWWARLGAAGLRMMHYLVGKDLAIMALLYADDGNLSARGNFHMPLLLAMSIWIIFDYPIKWEKVKGGLQLDWIGYWLDWETFRVGISERRSRWLQDWVKHVIERGRCDRAEMDEVLGRWGFAARVLEDLRPFLGPLYSWKSRLQVGKARIVPAMVRLILEFLGERLKEASTVLCQVEVDAEGEIFRGDARASEEDAEIGAWECRGGVAPEHARWFSMKITKEHFPWVFHKNDPKRVIAALELLTTLIAVMVFIPEGERQQHALVRISGSTDNRGNGFMMEKGMTTTFPACVVLMESCIQLKRRGLLLDLEWRRREENVEADDLSNGDFEKFCKDKRIPLKAEELNFEVLNRLMKRGEELYKQMQKDKADLGKARPDAFGGLRRLRKIPKLRIRAPWNDPYPAGSRD